MKHLVLHRNCFIGSIKKVVKTLSLQVVVVDLGYLNEIDYWSDSDLNFAKFENLKSPKLKCTSIREYVEDFQFPESLELLNLGHTVIKSTFLPVYCHWN